MRDARDFDTKKETSRLDIATCALLQQNPAGSTVPHHFLAQNASTPMTPDPLSERTLLQTRVPPALRTYLKRYAKQHGVSMEDVLTDVLAHFVTLRPDQRGLHWRVPHSNRGEAGAQQGWAQLNLYLPNDLAGKVVGLVMETSQTRATVLYTALFWFVRYLCPPRVSRVMETQRESDADDAAVA